MILCMQTCFRMRLCDLVTRVSKHSKQFPCIYSKFSSAPSDPSFFGIGGCNRFDPGLTALNEMCFKIFHADELHTPNSIWIVKHGLD